MIRLTMSVAALALAGTALAKLPPPDEAAKAKAAEAAAKTAWQGKMDAYLLCKAQDRVAARYKSGHPEAKPAATSATAATAASPAPAPAATGAASAPAPAAAAAASASNAAAKSAASAATATAAAAKSAASAQTSASQGGSTPVAAASATPPPVPACADPGPFAYAPPDQKPLETSGAHSPAANASSPPSVRSESGTMTSGKTGGTPKQ